MRQNTLVITLIGVCLVASLANACESPRSKEEYALFRSVTIGTKEADVIARLGQPTRAYSAVDAPADYYVPGYSYERRAISNKVLIYIGSEPIAYIYLDRQGAVEHVFVGGS